MTRGHRRISVDVFRTDTCLAKAGVQQETAARSALAIDQPDAAPREILHAANALWIAASHRQAFFPQRHADDGAAASRKQLLDRRNVGLSGCTVAQMRT